MSLGIVMFISFRNTLGFLSKSIPRGTKNPTASCKTGLQNCRLPPSRLMVRSFDVICFMGKKGTNNVSGLVLLQTTI